MDTVWGYSTIGSFHQKFKLPNQDAFRIWQDLHTSLVVVCDGVGSHDFAQIGSQQACLAIRLTCQHFAQLTKKSKSHDALQTNVLQWSDLKTDFLTYFHKQWLSLIEPYEAKQCGSTCLFALHINELMVLAQLGDGLVATVKGNQVVFPKPMIDKDFTNQTYALGEQVDLKHWQWSVLPSAQVDAVMLCTDGVVDDLIEDKLELFIKDMSEALQTTPIEQFAFDVQELFRQWAARGECDDRTMALMVNSHEDILCSQYY